MRLFTRKKDECEHNPIFTPHMDTVMSLHDIGRFTRFSVRAFLCLGNGWPVIVIKRCINIATGWGFCCLCEQRGYTNCQVSSSSSTALVSIAIHHFQGFWGRHRGHYVWNILTKFMYGPFNVAAVKTFKGIMQIFSRWIILWTFLCLIILGRYEKSNETFVWLKDL